MRKIESFQILKTGNFYFPVKDKNRKFKVMDTWDVEIPSKELDCVIKMSMGLGKKHLSVLLNPLAGIIWKHAKKQIKEKADWLCPQYLYKIGDDYVCSIDLLKEIKKGKSIRR